MIIVDLEVKRVNNYEKLWQRDGIKELSYLKQTAVLTDCFTFPRCCYGMASFTIIWREISKQLNEGYFKRKANKNIRFDTISRSLGSLIGLDVQLL
jgi:hypothetical protein